MKAQRVLEEFGEIPDAILKKTLTFAFLPRKLFFDEKNFHFIFL